jgi:hypothetical protein
VAAGSLTGEAGAAARRAGQTSTTNPTTARDASTVTPVVTTGADVPASRLRSPSVENRNGDHDQSSTR